MRLPQTSARAIVALLASLSLAGCGECVFDVEVTAVIIDADGDPVADARVRACTGERCVVGEADSACVEALTDADGRFTLEIPQCRPEPYQCELRPLLVEAEGCAEETVRVEMAADDGQTIALACAQP
jgi:hypothetical protein